MVCCKMVDNINIFSDFSNCFFKFIIIYSVGNAGKFNLITTIALLILKNLTFHTFDLFLQVTTHSPLNS